MIFRTIQSCNDIPEVLYKRSDLATIRSEGAIGQHLRRKRYDRFQKTTRNGRNAKFPRQTPCEDYEDLIDLQSYRNQTVDRTIHLITRDDLKICVPIARLVEKVKTSLWNTDPYDAWIRAWKPLVVLPPFAEDMTVKLRLVSYEDLLLLSKFDFCLQKALDFFGQPLVHASTQEVIRFFRAGNLLDFRDLIILEILGFLTQRASDDLLFYFPRIRENTHHESARRYGCTSYQFAELISNSHIHEYKTYLSVERISDRFHKALHMDELAVNICQQYRMKQPRIKPGVHMVSPSIDMRSESVHIGSPRIDLRRDCVHSCDLSLPQAIKGYKWLPRSAKRRFRKANQREKSSLEKKQPPLPKAMVPKRLAQWRKRKLERGTDPFMQCQTVWKSFSCGHSQRVLCYWCDDAWEKGITVECRLQNGGRSEADTRIGQNRFPYPCPICPWHEYPAFPPKHTWTHRTPMQSLLKAKGRAKPFVASRSNRSDLQSQQLSFDKEGGHPWEVVVRRRRRSRIPLE